MSRPRQSLPEPASYAEMANAGNELPGWLWHGFIAFGSVTLLTSRWKTGKTTLLSVLLSRLRTGGPLAGSETAAAPALVVSEESPALWVERGRKTPFGSDVRWLCRPFVAKPSREEWFGLVHHLEQLTSGMRTLIVIDPLAMVLPGFDENNAGPIIDSLAPLYRLATAGHAVLLLHHPRKGGTLEPRGSGAITGMVDILIEMDAVQNEAEHPNRRWLRARGRVDGVVRERLIELNAEHTDYQEVDPEAADLTDGWPVIEWVLSDATSKSTRPGDSQELAGNAREAAPGEPVEVAGTCGERRPIAARRRRPAAQAVSLLAAQPRTVFFPGPAAARAAGLHPGVERPRRSISRTGWWNTTRRSGGGNGC